MILRPSCELGAESDHLDAAVSRAQRCPMEKTINIPRRSSGKFVVFGVNDRIK